MAEVVWMRTNLEVDFLHVVLGAHLPVFLKGQKREITLGSDDGEITTCLHDAAVDEADSVLQEAHVQDVDEIGDVIASQPDEHVLLRDVDVKGLSEDNADVIVNDSHGCDEEPSEVEFA